MNRKVGRQRGWIGTIGVLLALLIIAWLVKDALKEYGLASSAEKATEAAEPTGLQRSPTPAAVSAPPPSGATPSYQGAVERARGVEGTVMRGAEAQGGRIDATTR